MNPTSPLITNDAIVCGIIVCTLAFVFWTSSLSQPFWRRFYSIFPKILLCYFIPSLFNTFGIISAETSQLYFVASRYLLPASLALLILPTHLREILRLGPRALIVFFAGTLGVVLGGPLAFLIIKHSFTDILQDFTLLDVAHGMSTLAGSWIGGGANQAAMKEVFQVKNEVFAVFVVADVLTANLWLAILLFCVGRAKSIDTWLKADASVVTSVRERIQSLQVGEKKPITTTGLLIVAAAGLGLCALAHLCADTIVPFISEHFPGLRAYSLTSTFFWVVLLSTTFALLLSFTRARRIEALGASHMGEVFLYVLIATIGMNMNLFQIVEHIEIFLVSLAWIALHGLFVFGAARIVRAPFFLVAVGSQANVGGAASAPIVASAFHPSLAAVGVLLAVLGYTLGTYGAYLCGLIMQYLASS